MASKNAYQFCETLLAHVRPIDNGAEIASVSRRDYDDATLVCVRTSAKDSTGVISALRKFLPLARVSLVENVMNGRTEAQVLLPNEHDQQEIAKALANYGTGQKRCECSPTASWWLSCSAASSTLLCDTDNTRYAHNRGAWRSCQITPVMPTTM